MSEQGRAEKPLGCRGVRGATCATEDSREAVVSATRELLMAMFEANGIQAEDVASLMFSATPDLTAAYPAVVTRELGLGDVAAICMQEVPVPGALARCIRVLVHWNTSRSQKEIEHIYLGEAVSLRPDRRWPRP